MEDAFFNIDNAKVKQIITFLKTNLPKKPTKNNYQLPNNFLHKEFHINMSLQDRLQKMADVMREHLLIEEPIKIMTMKNIDAGKFEMIGGLNCIYINESLEKQDFLQKTAILAHEMSHYFLIRKHKIYIENEKENELLTELNAIFCGFGVILFEGYKQLKFRRGNKEITSKVGYIDRRVVKEAIIETAYIRRQNPLFIINNLNLNILDKGLFYLRLRKLIQEYKKAKAKKSA